MKYYLLASGSKGNASCFINKNNEILLVDCGLTVKALKEKMESVGLDFNNIKAVLITHLHSDHQKAMRAFDPSIVYINEIASMSEFNSFKYYSKLNLVGFDILTLPLSHDSIGITGFLISYNNERLAYITDTGYVHQDVLRLINNCDAYLFESNHDPRMLMNTKRPQDIKLRILGPEGHLSNQDAAYNLLNIIGPSTKEIVFIHRSEEANSEEILASTFIDMANEKEVDISKIAISIARQDEVVASGSINDLFK